MVAVRGAEVVEVVVVVMREEVMDAELSSGRVSEAAAGGEDAEALDTD
jgi:hypothetical protein